MKFIENDNKTLGGIYKITNLINKKVYIGRTKNFKRRYGQYLYDFKFRRIKNINVYLLNSMEKYGFDNFTFEIINICSLEDSLKLEVEYMKLFKSLDGKYGYNLRSDSEGGMITSKRTSSKISERLKQEWKQGKRFKHSEKLTESWKNRNRKNQADVMSKNLTKYYYIINNNFEEKLNYNKLVEKGYKNVISSFHRKKNDSVIFKGMKIERFKLNNDRNQNNT